MKNTSMFIFLMLQYQCKVVILVIFHIFLQFKINTTIAIQAGDRIGWTCEGTYGVILFDYVNLHHTYFSKINISKTITPGVDVPVFPNPGTSVTFDPTYLPSLFSVAVELDLSKFSRLYI